MTTGNVSTNQTTTASGQGTQPTTVNRTTNGGGQGAPMVPARRMLYRSPTDKLLFGVCGGLAEYLGWNPVFVRVLWIVATFATWGGGLLAYILLAMFLPVGANSVGQLQPPAVELSGKGVSWAAGILIGVGALWLLANLGILPGMWRGFWAVIGVLFWPALLIAAGYLLLRANSQKDLDKEISDAARKVKETVSAKIPTNDQWKTGFSSVQSSMPLRRSQTNRVLMGVCGGVADKYGIDANLIRLIWAAFAIGTMGLGALLYFGIGLLLPEQGSLAAVNGNGNQPGSQVQTITIVDGNGQKKP